MPVHINDLKQFDKYVIQNPNLVIVEFGAQWCGTCHLLSSSIESLISQSEIIVQFYHVDFEHTTDVRQVYNVHHLPTYLLFKKGQVVDMFTGAISREALNYKIQTLTTKK